MNDRLGLSARPVARPTLPMPTRRRWQPLRLGLVELYHYDSEEFWFRDGHLLLRGNNGTGKSKVLSLTLPFLFDAQLKSSRIEPDGDAGKRMAWNLLMNGHDRRQGYAWIEFGRVAEDGTQHFLSLGAGMSASTARPQVDSWFFVLEEGPWRINQDLWLTSPQRVVLTRERLREAVLGRGEVFDTAGAYRRRVPVRVPPARGEVEGVVMGAEFVAGPGRQGQEPLELAQASVGQHAVARGIEQAGGGVPQRRRAIGPGAEMQRASTVVAQEQLGEGGPVALPERGLRAAPAFQPGEGELDVLAGAELGGGEVRAGAVVPAGLPAADRHAIAGSGDGVAHPELGEDGLAPEILEAERLLAAELPAQAALPLRRRQRGRRLAARELRLPGRSARPPARGLRRLGFHRLRRSRPRHGAARSARPAAACVHSHSIVPGGFEVMS